MAKKCVRCKRRQSIMVDEPLVMPIRGHCHDEIGLGIRVGRTVCDPEAWPDYTGHVKAFDGDIAILNQPDGNDLYLPATLLITTKPLSARERASWRRKFPRRFST
jgi:hypothetical protein